MNTTPRHATLDVEGMTCDACERHVSAALTDAGALEVSADFYRGVARLRLPDTISEDALAPRWTAPRTTPAGCDSTTQRWRTGRVPRTAVTPSTTS